MFFEFRTYLGILLLSVLLLGEQPEGRLSLEDNIGVWLLD